MRPAESSPTIAVGHRGLHQVGDQAGAGALGGDVDAGQHGVRRLAVVVADQVVAPHHPAPLARARERVVLAHHGCAGAVGPQQERPELLLAVGCQGRLPQPAPDEVTGAPAGHRGGRGVDPHDAGVEVGDQDEAGRGVEGGTGEPFRLLQSLVGQVLGGHVEELDRPDALVDTVGDPAGGDVEAQVGASDDPAPAAPAGGAVEEVGELTVVAEIEDLADLATGQVVGVPAEQRRGGPVDLVDPQPVDALAQQQLPDQRVGEVGAEEPAFLAHRVEEPVALLEQHGQREGQQHRADQVALGDAGAEDRAEPVVGERTPAALGQQGHDRGEADQLDRRDERAEPERGPDEGEEGDEGEGEGVVGQEDRDRRQPQHAQLGDAAPRARRTRPGPGRRSAPDGPARPAR